MRTMDDLYVKILGINFFVGSAKQAIAISKKGGLVVVPAAPAMVEMEVDHQYRDAVVNADLAITDSGFMVLLWNLTHKNNIKRLSGLEYLIDLLKEDCIREKGQTFFVMPTEKSKNNNLTWLNSTGMDVSDDDCYCAPMYEKNKIVDDNLLQIINDKKPAHIIVCLGGGVQEILGYYLRKNLDYKPGIHCIGAAIGFLSGDQVSIPEWADRYYIGWLFRCLSEPSKFIPRYWKAKKLIFMMLKYKDRLPG